MFDLSLFCEEQNGFNPNSLFYSDGYKVGHKAMLAEGTKKLYGTWIPRSLKYAPKGVKKAMSFGQQMMARWLHDEYKKHFFNVPWSQAKNFSRDMTLYLGLEYNGDHFEALHKVGYLPIRIKSLPEGIETPVNVPHMTFINTIDDFAWLTLYLETVISSLAWKPSTSATIALQYRRNLNKWVNKTDISNTWLIPYMAHDFSARGMSPWDMLSSGLGHATSFRGSDSIICIPGARYYYGKKIKDGEFNTIETDNSTKDLYTYMQIIDGEINCITEVKDGKEKAVWITGDDLLSKIDTLKNDYPNLYKIATLAYEQQTVCINSVNASEHSVSTTKIFTVGEKQMLLDWLKHFDKGILSVVSDTFDLTKVVKPVAGGFCYDLKEHILKREGKLVIRPDSGDPVDIICGHGITELTEQEKRADYPEFYTKGLIECLWEIFGGHVNDQGYKVLDSHIGAIYGDSITLERQIQIYERLAVKGFATTNIVLGIGSYTYQCNTRDALGFAAKGSWFEVENKEGNRIDYDIYKEPVTDDGTKKSLKGMVAVTENFEVITQCTHEEEQSGILQVIYENGKFYNETTLSEVRERIDNLVKADLKELQVA